MSNLLRCIFWNGFVIAMIGSLWFFAADRVARDNPRENVMYPDGSFTSERARSASYDAQYEVEYTARDHSSTIALIEAPQDEL